MLQNSQGILEQVPFANDFTYILYTNIESTSYASHWHPAIEVIMPIENSYEVVVSGNKYTLAEDDIIMIPAGELHELIAPTSGRRLILLLDHSLLTSLKGMSSILPVLQEVFVIRKDEASNAEIIPILKSLMLEMKEEYDKQDLLWETSVFSKVLQFFLIIGRKYLQDKSILTESRHNKQQEYIEKFDLIFEYIHNNYDKEMSLDHIASIAGFSKFHFSRLFKQFTNMSFYDYINKERMQAAESLLLNPDLSITDVAFQAGFSSISTFNRVFKSKKDCSPTEFRSLYQIK